MEDWVQLALGQGGALVVMILVSWKGFKFLTDMIEKQEKRSDLKSKKFDELHESTLSHIGAHTEAVKNLSNEIKRHVTICEMRKIG